MISMMSFPCEALQPGDRISTLLQSLHRGWKTPWLDIALNQMPKFRIPESSIVHVSLPHEEQNGPEMRLNPEEDVKFSLSFDHNKLLVPLTILYNAKTRRSLQQLVITFSHNEFDVLDVNFEPICKNIFKGDNILQRLIRNFTY